MIPENRADCLYSSIPLIESSQSLGVNGQFPAGAMTCDVIDLLRTEQSEGFFFSGNRYVYEPILADPRWFLYYSIYAEGAAGIPAPGDLVILMAPIDTSASGGATASTIGASQATEGAYVVNYTGPARFYTLVNATTVAENTGPLTGKIQLEGREITIFYQNYHVAQTKFRLTVSLRPV